MGHDKCYARIGGLIPMTDSRLGEFYDRIIWVMIAEREDYDAFVDALDMIPKRPLRFVLPSLKMERHQADALRGLNYRLVKGSKKIVLSVEDTDAIRNAGFG